LISQTAQYRGRLRSSGTQRSARYKAVSSSRRATA
jgi:hypothetical protein